MYQRTRDDLPTIDTASELWPYFADNQHYVK